MTNQGVPLYGVTPPPGVTSEAIPGQPRGLESEFLGRVGETAASNGPQGWGGEGQAGVQHDPFGARLQLHLQAGPGSKKPAQAWFSFLFLF